MATAKFLALWEFRVRPGMEEPFEALYGPSGAWVALFRSAPGYLATELLRDATDPNRYLTADRWESEASYRAFVQAKEPAYRALDAQGEALTSAEALLGTFLVNG